MASASSVIGKPYKESEERLAEYINSFWYQTRLSEIMTLEEVQGSWNVYECYKDFVTGHHFLVFELPGEVELIKVHLTVSDENQTLFTLGVTNEAYLNKKNVTKEALGSIIGLSAQDIFKKGHECLKNFGTYYVFNNCQDYCQKLRVKLGVKSDMITGSTAGIAGGIAILGTVGLGAVAYYLKSDKSDKK